MATAIERVKTLSEAYVELNNLKKKVNQEAKAAADAVRKKYEDELTTAEEQYEFIKKLTSQ